MATEGFDGQIIWLIANIAVPLHQQLQKIIVKLKTLSVMITQLSDYFISGNMIHMSVLTLLLAFVFLATWKAPAWVWKIGLLALVSGILFGILGYYQIQDVVRKSIFENGDISPAVLAGGYKCTLIPVIYGFIIFIVSLIINIFQSPRI